MCNIVVLALHLALLMKQAEYIPFSVYTAVTAAVSHWAEAFETKIVKFSLAVGLSLWSFTCEVWSPAHAALQSASMCRNIGSCGLWRVQESFISQYQKNMCSLIRFLVLEILFQLLYTFSPQSAYPCSEIACQKVIHYINAVKCMIYIYVKY